MRSPFLARCAPASALALALVSRVAPAAAADPPPPAGVPAQLGAPCARAPSAADSQTASVAARVAEQFFERGDWDKAIRYWTQAFGADCTAVPLLVKLADAYEKKGDKLTATAVLELYLERSSGSAPKPAPAPVAPPPPPTPPVTPPAPPTPAANPPVVNTPVVNPPVFNTPVVNPPVVNPPVVDPPVVNPPAANAPAPARVEPSPSPRPDSAPSRDDARTLRGHRFLFPALVDVPFVTSSVRLGTEIGAYAQRGVSVTALDSAGIGRVFEYDRDPRFVQQHFGVGFAISRYMGFDLDGTYSVLVGGNPQSAFLYGTSSGDDLRPGARLEILRLASTGLVLGARAYGLIQNSTRIRPAAVLEEIARETREGGNDPQRTDCLAAGDFSCAFTQGFSAAEAIRISRGQYGAGASVSAAQPIGKRFGVVASLGGEVSTAKQRSQIAGQVTSTPVAFNVGVAPSVDFAPTLPLGAMLEYRLLYQAESFASSNNAPGGSLRTVQHGVAAGLYYTGRKELQLGFIAAGSFTTSSSSEPLISVLSGRLAARYFF